MLRYAIVINWSDEDQSFIKVPELPGRMADGATYQEAIANAETIIQEWIETARELGRPSQNPKDGWFTHDPHPCYRNLV